MKRLHVWIPLLLSITLVAGMWVGFSLRSNIPETRGFFQVAHHTSLQEVVDLIRKQYVDTVNTDTLSVDAIQAMLNKLDPHTLYLPPVEAQEANDDLRGNFEGIGVEYQLIDDTVNIVTVLQDGPSDKAGIQIGDKILKVGDSLIAGTGVTNEQIKSLLRGPEGSVVHVTVLRRKKPTAISITRGLIPTYSADAHYMIDTLTGYIHLNKFSQTTFEEFLNALESLQKKGMKQLILDLRGNGGGILDEAVDVADEFLDGNKLVVYTQGAHSPKEEYRCRRPGLFEKGKLVVLVDEFSASASEVLAGSLQDWDRALLVGRRTFGKGLVQEPFALSNGAQLRLTIARYYTPAGRNIQKPFNHGREAYNEEVFDRFHHPNGQAADSTGHRGKEYLTLIRKRKVYGGGGITPDIRVPLDSFTFSGNIPALFYDQVFGQFIYSFYLQHEDYFHRFARPADLAAGFHPGEDAWQQLKAFALKDSVYLDRATARDREELSKRIRTWMARQIWRMEGYYELNNRTDAVVQRAMLALREENGGL